MAKQEKQREIHVFVHWKGMVQPIRMGILRASVLRGKEVFSFEYTKTWLATPYAQQIDPDLQLFTGPQYVPHNKTNSAFS